MRIRTPQRLVMALGLTGLTLSTSGCAAVRYKPTELDAGGESVIVIERSQPVPTTCTQVGFVEARNVHGDPVYMRNKLRNDSAELGATHVHIDDFNRLYGSGTAFVCKQAAPAPDAHAATSANPSSPAPDAYAPIPSAPGTEPVEGNAEPMGQGAEPMGQGAGDTTPAAPIGEDLTPEPAPAPAPTPATAVNPSDVPAPPPE